MDWQKRLYRWRLARRRAAWSPLAGLPAEVLRGGVNGAAWLYRHPSASPVDGRHRSRYSRFLKALEGKRCRQEVRRSLLAFLREGAEDPAYAKGRRGGKACWGTNEGKMVYGIYLTGMTAVARVAPLQAGAPKLGVGGDGEGRPVVPTLAGVDPEATAYAALQTPGGGLVLLPGDEPLVAVFTRNAYRRGGYGRSEVLVGEVEVVAVGEGWFGHKGGLGGWEDALYRVHGPALRRSLLQVREEKLVEGKLMAVVWRGGRMRAGRWVRVKIRTWEGEPIKAWALIEETPGEVERKAQSHGAEATILPLELRADYPWDREWVEEAYGWPVPIRAADVEEEEGPPPEPERTPRRKE